jgi:putative CocE/NonD family hydrolase
MLHLQNSGKVAVDRRTEMVSMSDGIRLATDLLIPTSTPIRGTIIERTPYGRKSALHGASEDQFQQHLEQLCRDGFTVLVQDCRGTGDSEGAFVKYLNEASDGVDTLAWAATQPWYGEGAYLMGVSYSAHAALAAAIAGAGGILGMYLDRGGFWSAFHEGIRLNGAFELKQASWGLSAAQRAARDQGDDVRSIALEHQDLEQWLQRLPWRPGKSPLRFDRDREADLFTQWDQESPGDYWEQPSLSSRGKATSLDPFPSLHISSWYDIYPVSTVKNFAEMHSRIDGDACLIMGPWTHSGMHQTYAGDVDFGPTATIEGAIGDDYFGLRRRWFEYCSLPLVPFGPRVTFFLMGGGSGDRIEGRLHHGGEWLASDHWPPTAAEASTWTMTSSGVLEPRSQHRVTEQDTFTNYIYDPQNPVPTIGGGTGSYPGVFEAGAFDQRERPGLLGSREPYMPLIARPDVLSFSTDPLRADAVVIGAPIVAVDFSTTGADTDITVKLIDYYPPSEEHPDGYAMNLCDTVVRLSAKENLQPIGTVGNARIFFIEIEMPPIANRFTKGHCIRLDISSSNFPRVDANNNLADGEPRSPLSATVLNGVRTGGPRISTLTLPLLSETATDELRASQARRLATA